MKMSGKVTIADDEVVSSGTVQEASDNVFQLLFSAYRKLIPRFHSLVEEYGCLEHAERKKRKRILPPFSKWIPTDMCEGDLELLQGPSKLIYVHKQLVIEHEHTGRLVTYAPAAEHSRCTQCYVQLISSNDRPVFGEIKLCFIHTFVETRKFVLLDKYSSLHLQQDPDSKLWWLPLDHDERISEQIVHELTCSFSSPLFTAKEGTKLWFLDSH